VSPFFLALSVHPIGNLFFLGRIEHCNKELETQLKKKSEAEEVKKNLLHKLDLHRDTIETRQIDLANIKRSLEVEKDKNHQVLTRRIELEMTRKEVDEKLRHTVDALSMSKKEYDGLKRKVKTKRGIADSAKETLPQLEQTILDNEHTLKAMNEEHRRMAKEVS
jgi:chromosome segregation ATPase